MSEIKTNQVVEMDYTLKNTNGEVIDSSEGIGPLSFIMGKQNIIPGLEAEIAKKNVGDSFNVVVGPDDAYGPRNEAMIQAVPKAQFGDNADQIQIGSQFQVQDQNGQPLVVQVIELRDDEIVLDANHPMAGQTLHFDVKILSTRDATPEELERGYLEPEKSECDPNGGCC